MSTTNSTPRAHCACLALQMNSKFLCRTQQANPTWSKYWSPSSFITNTDGISGLQKLCEIWGLLIKECDLIFKGEKQLQLPLTSQGFMGAQHFWKSGQCLPRYPVQEGKHNHFWKVIQPSMKRLHRCSGSIITVGHWHRTCLIDF